MIVGGGGAYLRPVIAKPQSAKAVSVYSFAELEAGPDSLTIRGWDRDGKLIDQGVIARR